MFSVTYPFDVSSTKVSFLMYLLTNIFPVKDLQKIVQEDSGIVKSQILYSNKSNIMSIKHNYIRLKYLNLYFF